MARVIILVSTLVVFLIFVGCSPRPPEADIRDMVRAEVAAALSGVTQGPPGPQGERGLVGPRGQVGSVVSAERFELVDADGNLLAIFGLGVDKIHTGPGLVLLNPEGVRLLSIAASPEGGSWIRLAGPDGKGRGFFSYLPWGGLTGGGGTSLAFYGDNNSIAAVELMANDDGGHAALFWHPQTISR